MRKLKHLIAMLAVALVTACTIPSDPDVLAGDTRLNASQAVGFFRDVCIASRPDYNGAIGVMSRMGGFTQNSNTEHYYHEQYNLSFLINTEIDGTSCVMQFANDRPAAYFAPSFQALSPRISVVQIRPGLVWVQDN